MGQFAIPLAIASSATQAVGSILAGREQARAAAFEQQQLNIQAEQQKTAASQAEAARREEFVSSLQTIQALRAGRGVGLGSPTGTAILQSLTDQEERDILTERANFLLNADRSRMAAAEAGRRRRSALLSGYLGAVGAIGDGATNVSLLRRESAPKTEG